tara:strand:- start:397 stop:690 length:294 start_codon:yes stop_codon:yes gene_type:complete
MEEDNKLIAEFIGYIYEDDRFFMEDSKGVRVYENLHHELKYDSSWDWLMPVIEKIMDISFFNGDPEDFYKLRDSIPDINETHESVVNFIKDYNNGKN